MAIGDNPTEYQTTLTARKQVRDLQHLKQYRNNPHWPSTYEKKIKRERRDLLMQPTERRSLLRTALVRAAVHTKNVMLRDHVLPEQVIRVGEFITSLRRELGCLMPSDSSLKTGLCGVASWSDILEPKKISKDFNNFSEDEVYQVIREARDEFEDETSGENLSNDLDTIKRSLTHIGLKINDMSKVNDKAESCLQEMRELAKFND